MKKLITNYLLKFMFVENMKIKDGAILKCGDDIFMFDDSNGNPNTLKWYFKINGFWNYIKAKENSIYRIEGDSLIKVNKLNSQGCVGLEYYKNCIWEATEYEVAIYKNIKYVKED